MQPSPGSRPASSCARAAGTDPADSTGLAHYLEHMLFKGTERLGTLDGAAERPHIDKIAALYDQLFSRAGRDPRGRLLAQIDKETQASSPSLVPNELDRLYTEPGRSGGMNAFTSEDWTMYLVDLPPTGSSTGPAWRPSG